MHVPFHLHFSSFLHYCISNKVSKVVKGWSEGQLLNQLSTFHSAVVECLCLCMGLATAGTGSKFEFMDLDGFPDQTINRNWSNKTCCCSDQRGGSRTVT